VHLYYRAILPRFFARSALDWWTVKLAMTQAPVFFATFAMFATFANFAAFAAA
jgi:hypothetical protein